MTNDNAQNVDRAWELMKKIGFAMLVTHDGDKLRARPMSAYLERENNAVYFLSEKHPDDVAPLLPAGTIVHITSWHDNSPANRYNPNPKNWVGGGARSIDEMSFAWVTITYLEEDDFQRRVAERKKLQTTQQGSEPRRLVADR